MTQRAKIKRLNTTAMSGMRAFDSEPCGAELGGVSAGVGFVGKKLGSGAADGKLVGALEGALLGFELGERVGAGVGTTSK
jgi:hypothetical protein